MGWFFDARIDYLASEIEWDMAPEMYHPVVLQRVHPSGFHYYFDDRSLAVITFESCSCPLLRVQIPKIRIETLRQHHSTLLFPSTLHLLVWWVSCTLSPCLIGKACVKSPLYSMMWQ